MKILSVDVTLYHLRRFVVTDQDSNVPPRGGAPVRVVITLLRDFQAPPGAIGILSPVLCCVALQGLVSSEQTWKKILLIKNTLIDTIILIKGMFVIFLIETQWTNERDNEGLRKKLDRYFVTGVLVFLTKNYLHDRFINQLQKRISLSSLVN